MCSHISPRKGLSSPHHWLDCGGIKALSPHQDHPGGEERSADLATFPGVLQRYNPFPRGNVPRTEIATFGHWCRRRQGFWCLPGQSLVLRCLAWMVESPEYCAFGTGAHCAGRRDMGQPASEHCRHVSHGQRGTGGHHQQTVIKT